MTTRLFIAALLLSLGIASAQHPVAPGQITLVTGNGNTLVTSVGALVSGHCVTIDANGNYVDSGAACGSGGGGGGGTVTSVFGRTPVVTAQSGDYNTSLVTESGNLYFTNARAVAAMAGLYQAPITGAPGTWPTFVASATTDTTNASNISSGTLNAARLPSTFSIAGPITLSGSGAGTEMYGCGAQTVPVSPANAVGIIGPTSCTGQHVIAPPVTGATGSTQVLTASGAESGGVTPTQWATPGGGGASYIPFAPLTAPPAVAAGWTAVNATGSTFTTQASGAITFFQPADSTNELHLECRTAPATPWTLTVMVSAAVAGGINYPANGIAMRESSSGKIYELGYQSNGLTSYIETLVVNEWTSATGGPPTNEFGVQTYYSPNIWLQETDNGTNVFFAASFDGYTFFTYYTQARTAFMSGGANQACISLNPRNSTYGAGSTVFSWAGVI